MIIGIDMGHTVTGPNYGAVGLIKESEETRVVGKRVISLLTSMGHKVVNCTVDTATSNDASLASRVAKANTQVLDIFVSLHFNAGGGKGTEVYTYNGNYVEAANRVLKNMEGVGFTNRGIKNGTTPRRLAVVNNTNALAMLVEVCFVDTQGDVDLYKRSIEKVSTAIAEGITGEKVKGENKYMVPDSVTMHAYGLSPIANAMKDNIKALQGVVGMTQSGVATEELARRLPELTGSEERGCVTVMQRMLILKGFLSSGSDTGIIGPANRNAITRLKTETGIPATGNLVDRTTWRKLLEY